MKKKIVLVLFAATAAFSVGPLLSLAGGSFFIDDTTSFVGIGNTTPQARLDVAGAMYSRLVAATSTTINWNQGNVQTYTLTSNTTFTFSSPQSGGQYQLLLTQDGTGGRTVTWPASVQWPNNTPPTLPSDASSTDVISLTYNGNNYLASYFLGYGVTSPPAINGSVYKTGNTATSLTLSTTVNSGLSNSILICVVAGSNTFAGGDVTGVTFNGSNMTYAFTQTATGGAGYDVWYMYSPSATTANVVASFGRSLIADLYCYVVTGAKQSGFPDAHGASNMSGTSANRNLTTNSSQDLVIDMNYSSGGPSSPSYGAGQTQLFFENPSGSTNAALSSYITKASAGTINTSMSWTGSVTAGIYGNFSIAPAP